MANILFLDYVINILSMFKYSLLYIFKYLIGS